MSNDPILRLLGLARKAGRLELGEEPVGAACRAKQAKLLLLAADAAPNTCRRAAHFGETGNVLWLSLPFTKEELGFVLGRGSCAMLAVMDTGFAASIGEKLAQRDPEHCGPAAQQLQERAQRTLQRQREKRQHEKNLREGKRKPWAPPPPEKKMEGKSSRPSRRAEGVRGGTGSPAGSGAYSAEHVRPRRPWAVPPPEKKAEGKNSRPPRNRDAQKTNGENRPSASGPSSGGHGRNGPPSGKGRPSGGIKYSGSRYEQYEHPVSRQDGKGGGRPNPSRSFGGASNPGPGRRKLTGKFRRNP